MVAPHVTTEHYKDPTILENKMQKYTLRPLQTQTFPICP